MPVLFAGPPGRVISMPDPGVQGILPPLITVNPDIGFQSRKSLITRVTMAQAANAQFMHTLGGDIYVYVFGDRIGEMTVSGLSIAHDCERDGDREHGFEQMMQWYNENRLSKRTTPVTMLIGRTAVTGFVTGLNGGVFDHKLFLMQFDITMALLPEKD